MRGTVVKRGKGYTIVYDLGRDTQGKRVQKWESGFHSKKQAEKVLRARIDEIEGSFANRLERSSMAVYLCQWMKDYCIPRLSQNTVNGYRINIENHVVPVIGKIPLYKLQPTDINALYAALREKGLSGTSILYVHRTLHKALASAVKNRLISNNVIDYVETPLKERYKPTVLTAEQVSTLLNACRGGEIQIPVLFAVLLGLRRGEALGTVWSDFDEQHRTLEIQRSITFYKGGYALSDCKTQNSHRTLLLADSLVSILLEHRERQQAHARAFGEGFNLGGFIVCRADGLPMTAAALNYHFKMLLREHELPDIRFHDLRHTNATLMLKNQIPAKIVSSMLGHSTIAITMDTYSHVLTDMQQSAVNVVEQLLKP